VVKQVASSSGRHAYVATLEWGVVSVIVPGSAGWSYLLGAVMAGAAAWWVACDARDRGKPILHILQMVIFLCWPIAIPTYLIASREFAAWD